ncbi:MAG: hypothetical protein ACE5GW_05675, partial [Planctomycetota bacterium]
MAVPGMKIGGQGRGAFLVLACALTGFVLPAAAQTGNRLSRLQQEAREYMRSIERQMDVLSEKLEGTQPDDAGRLQRARARIFQELVFDEMREISDLLETEEYLPALERIGQVRESLEEILAILQDRGPDPEELQRKLEELGRRRATVGQLADQQRELRDRTRDIEKAAADLETIRGVQEGIDELRAEQEALQGKTDGGDEDLQAAGREQLQGMQAEAEELARKLAEEAALQGTLGDIARRLEELAREARESVKQGAVRLEEGGGAEELSSDPEWSRLGEGSRERGRQAQALSQELAAAARQEAARAAGEAGEQRRQAMEEARRTLE